MNLLGLFFERNHLMQLGAEAVLAVLRAAPAHGEVPQRCMTGIEVAVIHQIAGRIDRAGFDLEARMRLAFAPYHGKAFTLRHTHDRARTMAVEFATAADRKFLHVTS